jgi:hypothetical protein
MAILGLDASRFQSGLNKAASAAQSAGQKIGHHLGGKLGVAAMTVAAEEAIRKTIEYGEHVADLSNRLAMLPEAVQQFDFALKQNGASIDAAVPYFERLAANRDKALKGNGSSIDAFQKLGVSIGDLKNKRIEDIALQIGDVFKAGGDSQELIGALREIGGRGAGEMMAAMKSGLREAGEEAKNLGIIIDTDTIAKLKEAGDRYKTFWQQIRGAIAPVVAWAGNGLAMGVQAMFDQIKRMGAYMGGFSVSGFKGGKQAVADFDKEIVKREEEMIRRRASLGKNKTTSLEEEESAKAVRAADQLAKRKEELAERLAKLQEKHYVDSLSKEERVTELHRKRAELAGLLADNWSKMTDEQRLKAEIDVEELKGEEDRAQRDLDKPKHGKAAHDMARNSLQAIGAYGVIAPHEQQMLDATRQSEGHLREIKEHMVKGHGTPHNRGVHF